MNNQAEQLNLEMKANDRITLQYHENKDERNALIKEKTKKIVRKNIFSILFLLGVLILSFWLGNHLSEFGISNILNITLSIILIINITKLFKSLMYLNKIYKTPVESDFIILEISSHEIIYKTTKATIIILISEIERLEILAGCLIIIIRNSKLREVTSASNYGITIYSNAFNKMSCTEILNILQKHIDFKYEMHSR